MEGWISLYRKFMNWQWYKNSNVKAVFIHLLLCANHKEEMVGRRIVHRGQLITSRDSLSEATGLSPREIRTCLSKLKSTDEIEVETTNKYSVITIKKYDIYQRSFEEGATSKKTDKTTNKNKQQATNKKDDKTTSKINLEMLENKGEEETVTEKTTNKKEVTATNKNDTTKTNKIASKTTTNNNIYNNTNNNLTKLNNIFNLIINNNAEEIKMTENALQGLKMILKRLDLEVTSEFLNIIPEKLKVDYQIIYFAILALYNSSYVVYVNKLNRETIFNKLLKTKEYLGMTNEIDDAKLKEFLSYYIKCLQDDLEKRS